MPSSVRTKVREDGTWIEETTTINKKDQAGLQRFHIFRQVGFHGDKKLMEVIDVLSNHIQVFVETGTESGSTIAYMDRMYPHLQCYTCEIDDKTYNQTVEKLKDNHPNIHFHHRHSVRFLQDLAIQGFPLFWLDAHSHGYGGSSLTEEIETIMELWDQGYIMIDDFKVPHDNRFGYDRYKDVGDLEWSLIEPVVRGIDTDGPVYPHYEPEKISRGWILFAFGKARLPELPDFVGV